MVNAEFFQQLSAILTEKVHLLCLEKTGGWVWIIGWWNPSFTLFILFPLRFHCVMLGSYFAPCKLLLQSQKCVCRCIYDLFTFRAYLLKEYGQKGILLDKLDTAVRVESDNATVSVAARKNKTWCMINTRHAFPINGGVGFNGIFHKSYPCQIHYPQKVIAKHSKSVFQKWPQDLGNVTECSYRWHLAVMQKVKTFVPFFFFLDSKISDDSCLKSIDRSDISTQAHTC